MNPSKMRELDVDTLALVSGGTTLGPAASVHVDTNDDRPAASPMPAASPSWQDQLGDDRHVNAWGDAGQDRTTDVNADTAEGSTHPTWDGDNADDARLDGGADDGGSGDGGGGDSGSDGGGDRDGGGDSGSDGGAGGGGGDGDGS